jgi:hypothetical protein
VAFFSLTVSSFVFFSSVTLSNLFQAFSTS